MILRRALLLAAVLVLLAGLGVVWWVWRQGLVTKAMSPLKSDHPTQKVEPPAPEPAISATPATAPAEGTEVRAALRVPAEERRTESTTEARPSAAARIRTGAAAAKPIDAAWQAIAGGPSFRVHVWSLEPLAEGLKPPASLREEEWRDAVLTRSGGAALLKERSIVIWHVGSPGTGTKFHLPDGPIDLQGTPDEVLVRCRNGAVYALPSNGSGSPRLVAEQIRALYPSARTGELPGFTTASQMVILNLDGSGTQRSLAARWRASHEPAALTADGKLWAVSGESKLWVATAEGADFEFADEGPISDIRPMGAALVGIETNEMALIAFNGGQPPPGGFAARRVLAAEGTALATDDTGNAVIWGPRVPESPRTFRLPEGTWQVRLGPTGLMVAW